MAGTGGDDVPRLRSRHDKLFLQVGPVRTKLNDNRQAISFAEGRLGLDPEQLGAPPHSG